MEKQIEKALEFIEAKKAKGSRYLLPLDLQTFAKDTDPGDDEDDLDDEDDNSDDEDDDDNEDPSLERMLKDNPKLKKEFNKLFKDRFDKRLKGVDLKEAKRLLKEKSDKADQDDQEDKDKKVKAKNDEISEKERKLDNKLKRSAVKEYAIDNDLSPKLLSRLVDLSKLELNDDGEIDPEDLEELVDELTEEFPELFRKAKDEDQDEDEDTTKKARSHKVGSKKKTNKPKPEDLREAGKNKALERAKRKGLIKE